MKLKSLLKSSLILISFICLSTQIRSQPGDGNTDPDPDPNPNGGGAPFDFGLSVLVAAGVGYAAKKKYDAGKKKLPEDNNANK